MKPTLANSLEIILPHLSPEIAAPEALSRLRKLAQLSAPIHRAGFECRLGEGITQIDLQQCIFAKDNEPKILAEHIATVALSSNVFEQSAWNRIRQFCEAWSDSSSYLHEGITEIWLEFDLNELAPQTLVPSVFITLNRQNTDSDKALKIAETALELLWGQQIVKPLQSNLHRCFTACSTPARISHIGVMLSRQIEALRINVSWLPPDKIASYLQQVGWLEPAHEIETLALQLLDVIDRVRICLDVGTTVYPKLGLECFFNQQHGLELGWLPFLDNLVARGLCRPEKREALIAWPGYTTPTSSSNPWPNYLITESLLQPPNQFSVFERRLSHIKLIYQPQQPLEAKGYLEFLHQWWQTNFTEDPLSLGGKR